MRKTGNLTLIRFLLVISATATTALIFPTASFSHANSGKAVYDRHCANCHGVNGDGRGVAADYLTPAPRDFTLGLFKWKTTPYDEMTPSIDDLRLSIAGHARSEVTGSTGLNGTSMPGWSDVLSVKEVDELAAYVKSFSGAGEPTKPAVRPLKKGLPSSLGITNGERLYKDRCSECHGQNGRGDATKKLKDDWGARTWPRDLTKPWTFRAGAKVDDIYTRITVGIPGTQMPSFGDQKSKKYLTDDERMDVASYVFLLEDVKRTPSGDGAIKASFAEAGVPASVEDARWGKAEYANILAFPQLMRGDKLYAPSLDAVSVKAIYDDKDIAFLMAWNDRTQSVPGDAKAVEIAGGTVLPDAAAIQFPASYNGAANLPHFDMGSDIDPVIIWRWQNREQNGGPGTLTIEEAAGPKDVTKLDPAKAGVGVASKYENGSWKVVFKSSRNKGQGSGITGLSNERPLQAALKLWDGSNGDAGDKHVLSGWVDVHFLPRSSSGQYAWPAAVFLIVFVAGLAFVVWKGGPVSID